jgi:ENTS family enterobactin (siderophore) exporter
VATRVRRIAVDLTPLRRSRDFRLLWLGELVSETGSNITLVALYIQVFRLTRSSLAVGAIGLV